MDNHVIDQLPAALRKKQLHSKSARPPRVGSRACEFIVLLGSSSVVLSLSYTWNVMQGSGDNMLTMQSFREPSLADEVLTPACLPPSAASLTTRGRSLFNEVLMAIRTRHRSCSNNPAYGTSMDYTSEITAPPSHTQSSSQSTWNRFSSERHSHPTQLCSSHIQVSSTLTPSATDTTVVLNWRHDQNSAVSGVDPGDLRLAKTRDHIRLESGPYATGRHQSAIGLRSDDITIYDDVGLQTNCDSIMIHSERVACGKGEESRPKHTVTTAVLSPVPSSSSDQYCLGANTERDLKVSGQCHLHQAKPKSVPKNLKQQQQKKKMMSRQTKLKVVTQGTKHSEGPLQTKNGGLLKDVRQLTTSQLEEVKCHLTRPHLEVACTLVYSDLSTQLRNRKETGKGVESTGAEIVGVALAYPVSEAKDKPAKLHFIHIPLSLSCPEAFKLQEWSKSVILSVMSRARVICYRGQELATALISRFSLINEHAWLDWCIMDTSVSEWLLNPDLSAPRSFADLARAYSLQTQSEQDAGAIDGEITICKDLSMLGPLMTQQYKKMVEENLWSLYEEIEIKLIPILAAMGVVGVQINTAKLLQYTDLLKAGLIKVEQSVHKAAGHPFVINSTSQLRQVLFEELQLDKQCSKKLSNCKTQIHQQKSTSESVLLQLKDLHPLPGLILQYRQISKLNATYVTGILPFIKEGILKPHWQQTVAATGRLTSSMPNIQAFPREPIHLGPVQQQYIIGKSLKEISIDVRETVESRSGFSFLAADFKSIELRLVAHLSEDPRLLSLLNSNENSTDVFTLLASEWLGMSIDSITHVERERTKRVVYAVIYGVGKERLAEILNVDSTIAKELRASFLQKFSNVQEFITSTISEAREKGCLSTICNRKRWFPNLNSANPQLRSHAERQAVNFPVQGSAADLCKKGMIQVMRMLAQESPSTKLLLQIHDELIFEVPDEQIRQIAGRVKGVLESLSTSCQLKVPLEVRINAGKNWAELNC